MDTFAPSEFKQIASEEIYGSETLQIHNFHSAIDNFYSLKSSYQVSYQCYDGASKDGLFTYTALSPNEVSHSSMNAVDFFNFSNHRVLHHHDFYELMLVLEGSVVHRIESMNFTYSAGTCCLVNKNIRHVENYVDSGKLLFIDLSDDFLHEVFSICQKDAFKEEVMAIRRPIFDFFRPTHSQQDTKAYIDFNPTISNTDGTNRLHELVTQLTQTIIAPYFGASFTVKGLICQIFDFLSLPQNYHTTIVTLDSKADFLLFSRVSHMLEDCNGIVTRHELEEKFHYSASYINSIIKKYSGMNLFDYRMTFCMLRAALLLSTSQISIGEIMESLGFSNPTHFYNVFKKSYQMTPLQYRKQHSDGSNQQS